MNLNEEDKKVKKLQDLKYRYARTRDGDMVLAENLLEADRNAGYTVVMTDKNGISVDIPVHAVLCKKRRSHFRVYSRGIREKIANGEYTIDMNEHVETSYHVAMKDLFEELKGKRVQLPEVKVYLKDGSIKQVRPRRLFHILDVNIEERDGTAATGHVRYDITLIGEEERKIAVEIYVTHKVDEVKLNKLKAIGMSTIEIDLSELYRKDIPIELEDDTSVFVNNIMRSHWVYEEYAEMLKNIYDNCIVFNNLKPSKYNDALLHNLFMFYLDDKETEIDKCSNKGLICTTRRGGGRYLGNSSCTGLKCNRCLLNTFEPGVNRADAVLVCNQSDYIISLGTLIKFETLLRSGEEPQLRAVDFLRKE